jgi:hypothetical protein
MDGLPCESSGHHRPDKKESIMSDARDDALETPSGDPLDTGPVEGTEPYDADGFVEPRSHEAAGDEEADDIPAGDGGAP